MVAATKEPTLASKAVLFFFSFIAFLSSASLINLFVLQAGFPSGFFRITRPTKHFHRFYHGFSFFKRKNSLLLNFYKVLCFFSFSSYNMCMFKLRITLLFKRNRTEIYHV